MSRARRQGEDRILTVPNGLTALRLACLPVFLVLLAQPHRRDVAAAACMLAVLGVTDGLDGYVARHFHQVSSLGKLADPFVDRALVLSAVIGAVAIGAVPAWLVAIVLLREALVLAGAVVLALAGARHPDGPSSPRRARAKAETRTGPLWLAPRRAGRDSREVAEWPAARISSVPTPVERLRPVWSPP
jgi:phosphatidylglycerophosphate synthase